jgi:hypothetical protein
MGQKILKNSEEEYIMLNCKALVLAVVASGVASFMPAFADDVSSSTSMSSDNTGVSKTSTSEVDVSSKPVAPTEVSTQSIKSSHCSMKTMNAAPKSVSTRVQLLIRNYL